MQSFLLLKECERSCCSSLVAGPPEILLEFFLEIFWSLSGALREAASVAGVWLEPRLELRHVLEGRQARWPSAWLQPGLDGCIGAACGRPGGGIASPTSTCWSVQGYKERAAVLRAVLIHFTLKEIKTRCGISLLLFFFSIKYLFFASWTKLKTGTEKGERYRRSPREGRD